MRLITLSILLIYNLMLGSAWADPGSEWESVRSAQDPTEVRTWVKPVAGAAVEAFRGEVDLDHSWLEVLTILDRVDLYPQWVFRCTSARRVEGGGLYLNFKAVWPVSDRDVYTHSKVRVHDQTITILTENKTVMEPRHDGYVRIPRLENAFDVIPLPSGGTRVIFTTYVDPGGSVPRWLSNLIAIDGPLQTLQGLKQVLQAHGPGDEARLDALSAIYEPVKSQLAQLECAPSNAIC